MQVVHAHSSCAHCFLNFVDVAECSKQDCDSHILADQLLARVDIDDIKLSLSTFPSSSTRIDPDISSSGDLRGDKDSRFTERQRKFLRITWVIRTCNYRTTYR